MAEPNELDAFLGAGAEPAPEPQQAPPPEPPEPVEEPGEDEGNAAEPDEGEPEPTTQRDGRTVPLSALEAERAQRRDWKAQAVRAETERDELRRQLEEAKRAPQPQYQPPQPIDPVQQPEAFVERVQSVVLNERLNTSELLLRREIGAEAVDAAIAEFKQAAAKDPSLFPKLYQQPDPYSWLAKQVEVMKIQREIGDDPAAYRARLRAEIEAEMNATAPAQQVSPAARMAPSLANARSAAPRATGAWAGPTPLSDLFPNR